MEIAPVWRGSAKRSSTAEWKALPGWVCSWTRSFSPQPASCRAILSRSQSGTSKCSALVRYDDASHQGLPGLMGTCPQNDGLAATVTQRSQRSRGLRNDATGHWSSEFGGQVDDGNKEGVRAGRVVRHPILRLRDLWEIGKGPGSPERAALGAGRSWLYERRGRGSRWDVNSWGVPGFRGADIPRICRCAEGSVAGSCTGSTWVVVVDDES